MAMILLQSSDKVMRSTENRRWPTDGLRTTASKLITSRRLILTTRPRGDKDTDTKVLIHFMTTKDRQCGPMNKKNLLQTHS